MRDWRKYALAVSDLAISVAGIYLGFVIRFALEGRPVPPMYMSSYLKVLPFVLPLRTLTLLAFGLYWQMWSHASLREILRVVWAISVDAIVTFVVTYQLLQGRFPRSVLIIGWFITLAGTIAVRVLVRLRREGIVQFHPEPVTAYRTLIFGAGDAGALLMREITKHHNLGFLVLGFIDDDPLKQGYQIAGKRVLGTRVVLPEIVAQHHITHMIIAAPSVGHATIREIVELGRRLGLQLKTVPGLYELVDGRVTMNQIRDVQIEDLLGRDEVKVDLESIAQYLSGEVVLVTGAGGSIGSELCRQVAGFQPCQIVLVGHGENTIYEIDLELRQLHPGLSIIPVIADVQDKDRIDRVFKEYRPGVVFHAAAHKHVPLMEANPGEAVKNNIFGTFNVASAADAFGVKRFVLISSDKAVNPTSVMGATKRAAEQVIQLLNRSSKTVYVAVRFGNVLGSRGSVIPLFKKQIAAGGPVTVTDPRMVRYFMTIPEAVQLVIQAAALGKGGEIFVLDMGQPVKIVDLARDLIRLSGFEPEVDIPIQFTGMRPGEKLYEELLTSQEGSQATMHERIFVAPGISKQGLTQFKDGFDRLREHTGTFDQEQALRFVHALVPEFQPEQIRASGKDTDAQSPGSVAGMASQREPVGPRAV